MFDHPDKKPQSAPKKPQAAKPAAAQKPQGAKPVAARQTQANGRRRNGARKHGHDYQAPWKYHITISKAPGCPDFSSLAIRELLPEGVGLTYSPLGLIIFEALKAFQLPYLRIYQHSIMPDHLHLLIHVKERLPRHLGFYIAEFKSRVTAAWRLSRGVETLEVFEENYYDRIILPEHSLNDVYQYIRQNPYRLAVRKSSPEFFQKIRGVHVDEREVQVYGNPFLLRNPFKYALIVHRADDDTVFARKLEECLYHAANGGVVVSAFISKREKEIRRQVEAAGGRLILIHDRPLAEREKPAKHDFELCAEGRLLLLSPIDYESLPKAEHPPRYQCLDMNALAETLASSQTF